LQDLLKLDRQLEQQAQLEKVSNHPWYDIARPKQLPPHHPRHHQPDENGYACGCGGVDTGYEVFLMCAGRGLGKTRAGASDLTLEALAGCAVNPGGSCSSCPHTYGAIGPTREHVQQVLFEGPSGILKLLDEDWTQYENSDPAKAYNKSILMVTLFNGAKIVGFSAERANKLRGYNLSGAWVDELGVFRYDDVWDQMRFALRIGTHPRIYVTTTPRPTRLIKQLFAEVKNATGKVHLTTGSTQENVGNLSEIMVASLYAKYGQNVLGLQELEGQLIEDIPGAFWRRDWIERNRVRNAPEDLTRCVVAIDPATTSGEDSDESGIIVAGMDANGHAYVLDDLTVRAEPGAVMHRAIRAYYEYKADCIVAEQNNGGDFIKKAVQAIDPQVPYKQVYASRGKVTRAEPISVLYSENRVHHVGMFADLEDQMCTWVKDAPNSPDRVDALVWAISWMRDMYGSWSGHYAIKCAVCDKYTPNVGDPETCKHCGAAFRQAA
jgi:predicted phage terminase large subunit-like protein